MTGKLINLIFLHGWGSNAKSWENNTPYLVSAGYKCNALKLPGFDLPEPTYPWGIPEYAEFVVKEIGQNKDKYILIGHSFGGRIATYIASTQPQLVGKLILTDSAGLNLEPKLLRTTLVCVSNLFEFVERMFPFLRNLRKIAVGLIGSKNYKDASIRMREIMKKVVNLDLKPNLSKITCPTLIIWGDNDEITPKTMAEAFKKGIQHSQIKYINNAGHHAHSTHATEWNKIVGEFLAK